MIKKYIVTGGCGYIGSHVVRALKQHDPNCHVHIIDRVSRSHTLKNADGWLIDDYASDAALSLIIDLEPDAIVHCAGTSLVGPSMIDPSEYYSNNVIKTIRMLDVIKHMPKKPVIIFSSSASVYGEPDTCPIVEDSAISPISPYGSTKAMIERILSDYAFPYSIPSISLRYFNAAGAEPNNFDLGQEPGATHIIARALEASITGQEFVINGYDYETEDGTCVRDYVHVWDLAHAHVMAIDYAKNLKMDHWSESFNLGTNNGISNKKIAEYVGNKYGLNIKYSERRAGDPDALVADARKANNMLLWYPKWSSMETIIDSAYKWYRK